MKRVGYDADTERYTFREGNDLWLGESGSFYGGRLKWAGKAPQTDGDDEKEEDTDGSSTGHRGGSGQWPSAVMANRVQPFIPDHSNTLIKSLREYTREATRNGKESPQNVADNPWGVPIVSISATGAKPPDSPKDENAQTYPRKVRRAATLTTSALGIINRRLGKDANTDKRTTTE
jgi:hypothetical protein